MLRRFGRAIIPTPGYAVLSDFYNFAVGTRRLGRAEYLRLKRNCEAYGPRAVLLNAGLWPTRARLKVVESGSHIGFSVTEVGDGVAFDCESYSPADLIALGGRDRIDLFKIDIEGAEAELFSATCDAWLERTRVLMIEIHGPDAERAVRAAVGRHRFKHYRHREVHMFINQTIG
jgi:FkbM family methyltransferase